MRFFAPALLLAATLTTTLAKPLPASLDEIERRWSNGESEASIHAAETHRDATPAWPVVRNADEAFAYATDERTMLKHYGHRHHKRSGSHATLMQQMKALVKGVSRRRGEEDVFAAREVEPEEAPVLRPRGAHRYHFQA